MGFQIELLSRPRPSKQACRRTALELLHALSNADRRDVVVKAADFPRIAREIAVR